MGKKETPWIIADCPGRVQICPSWALRARQAGRAAPAWRLWAGRNGPPRLGSPGRAEIPRLQWKRAKPAGRL